MVRRVKLWGPILIAVLACAMFFAFASSAFAVNRNPECTTCHQSTATDWSVGTTTTPGGVNRLTACVKCHTSGLRGTHPKHYPGGNCGAVCHKADNWGASQRYAVPTWVGVEGSFATSSSVNAPAALIHVIHSQKTWISTASKATEKCASCHGVADCAACHDALSVSAYHQQHSATGDASWTAQTPWTGTTSHGVVGGDMTWPSDFEVTNQCATTGCHNVAGMSAGAPVQRESHSHAPITVSPVTDVVAYPQGPWLNLSNPAYTATRAVYTNKPGYSLSTTFPAQIIEVVTDVDPYRGMARIYIDGVATGTIDCYSPTTAYQQIVFRSGPLSAGNHNVTIEVLGTKNPASRAAWIFADGFRAYTSVLDYAAPKCLTCHPGQDAVHGFTYSHIVDDASFTAGTYVTAAGTFTCDQCHGALLTDEHRRTSSKVADANCNACHTTYAPKIAPSGTIGCTQVTGMNSGCHQTTQAPHNFVDTNHTLTADADEAKCRGCHGSDLDVTHNDSITTNSYVTNCLSCHGPTLSPVSKRCTDGCHTASGVNSMETHSYDPAPHSGAGTETSATVANTGGFACETCHESNLELAPEHSRTSSTMGGGAGNCSSCHDLSYIPIPWDGTCADCHSGGVNAPVPHGEFSTKHDYSVYSAANVSTCGGVSCHDVTKADLIHSALLPGTGDCTSCHTGVGVPTKRLCTDCHVTHNVAGAHQSTTTECLRCHDGFANINTSHPSCATCHSNPLLTDYLQDNYTPTCTGCHSAAVLGGTYTPADPQHYLGTEPTHTAGVAQAALTYDYDGAGSAYVGRRCDACHSMEMKPEHITKTYTNFSGVPATYPDKCVACHEQKVDGLTGGWNDTCDACHATKHAAVTTVHNATGVILMSKVGSPTAGTSCGTAGCHDVTKIEAIHNNSVTSNDASASCVTTCLNTCHSAAPTQAKSACDAVGCHFGMADHNADHAPAANDQCGACHESSDVKTVHGGASYCTVCHGNPVYPGITTTNTASCGDGACHNASEIGGKSYALPDSHYAGEEASHTSSGNGTYNTYSCVQCHLLTLKDEHAKVSVAYMTGSYAGTTTVIGKCVGCHELKVDGFTLAWDKKCISCHPSTHTERAAKHDASASGCGPSKASGCHDANDVALIHNNSITTNSMFPSCLTCHKTNTAVPAPIDCDAVGCHAGMTHSHSLNLTSSNYNNTSVTGCTNSGIGCHGSMATSPTPDYAVSQYHPDSGCTSGACHRNAANTATNTTQPNPAFNNPQTCQNCHGGRTTAPLNYENAADVVTLTAASSALGGGHYNETSHTIVSVVTTMSVGGVSTATCVTCHQHTNPNGVDGEWYQHQVLQGYGNTTCYDCHSFVTPGDVAGTSRVGNLIQTAVGNGTDVDCVDCHNALIMGTAYVMHETTSSPPATATVLSTPQFNCADTQCHGDPAKNGGNPLEIHFLHKGDGKIVPFQRWNGSTYTTYTVDRCAQAACHPNYTASGDPLALSGSPLPTGTGACEKRPEPQCVDCHDPLLQGWKPTQKSCGVNGNCHITSPHSQMGPAHSVTALSGACIECHETTDLRGNHGYSSDDTCGGVGINNVCHSIDGTTYTYNSVQYTFDLTGKKECKDCHALGMMPNVTRDHAPHDPNHYVGSEATHTAINQTGTFGSIYSVVATDGYNTGSFPASVTVSSASLVQVVAEAAYEGSYGARIYNTSTTRATNWFQRTFDTASCSSPTVSFYYKALNMVAPDYSRLEYSTDGVNFTQLWNTATTQSSWTYVGPLAVPRSASLTLRFSASTNANNSDKFLVDLVTVKPSDSTGAGCFLTCHYDELKPEHFKVSAEATRVPGIYSDKCIDCHENRVDSFDTSKTVIDWDRTCVQCHGTEKHYGQTARHDASAVRPDCGGSGCHYIKDVAVIHNNSALGNAWPTDPAQTCTVCHSSKLSTPSSLDCGSVGCHEGMTAHAHELDRDGSLFNPATVTGCVDSGAGCHGNLTTTNYATGYHAAVGCISGNCHNANATNHNDPQFNDPNTCMNCHGGGSLLYAGATDRIPVTGATPNGHYPETTHTAGAASRTASMSAGGTITARCNQCHNDVNASGSDGLYNQHTGVSGSITNVTCVDCHNYSVGVSAQITGDWTTNDCTDCHNVTLMPAYSAHNSSVAPVVAATEAQGAGTCQATGCHVSLDLHALHKGSASTPSTRTALGCAFSGCHDYTKQGAKPTKKSCGVGGDCHMYDSHNPTAHNIVDSANCTRCHEGAGGVAATSIQNVYVSTGFGNVAAHTCASCHNGGANLGATNTADCVDCHNATEAGTHAYTPYDPNHYYTASHDSSVSSTRNWGTTNYGSALTDYHGATRNYERGCTTCHTIDLMTEHNKTSVTFNLGGKADKCAACHELKVDNWSGRWTGSCSGEANSCHDDAALHNNWGTKHDASAAQMTTPGPVFTPAGSSPTTVMSENWGTGTTWPTATFPTRSSTTYVLVSSAPPAGRTGSSAYVTRGSTTAGVRTFNTGAISLTGDATVTWWYSTVGLSTGDYAQFQYSTNGTTWINMITNRTTNVSWTQGTFAVPAGTSTLYVRFGLYGNTTSTEKFYVDDFVVTDTLSTPPSIDGALPANSTAAVSCMNNPNGTNCHDVTDVADIHAGLANNGCPTCHMGTTQHPTNVNCQSTGCHVGINLNNHNSAWHESTFGSTSSGIFSGSGIATAWCRGCHDDSIDNEHFVLTPYGASPCSMCHKKGSDSGAPTNVTSTNTSATIHGDSTAGNELCESCHKTMGPGSLTASGTSFGFHVQRSGLTTPGAVSEATTAGIQFSPTWSGHRTMTAMPGMKTSFMPIPDGVSARYTWTLPTASSFLQTGWQNTSQMVACSDCHGDVSGAAGPHGGTMALGLAAGYDNSYSKGTLTWSRSTGMSNTTNLCFKCHVRVISTNNVHTTSDHDGYSCITCHVKTPHAWKRPRLIGYTDDPAAYATVAGEGMMGIKMKNYTPTGWVESDCYAGCDTGKHPNMGTSKWK